MSCLYQNCANQVKASCKTCQNNRFLCKDHAFKHNEETNHEFTLLDQNKIRVLMKYNLDSLINNCISQINEDTNKIIAAVVKASNEAIKLLRTSNNNLNNISEFKSITFDKRRIRFLIDQVSLISSEMRFSLQEKVIQLSSELNEKTKNIKEMSNEIDSLKDKISNLEQEKNAEVEGDFFIEFNNMNLKGKKIFITMIWGFIEGNREYDQELIQSRDGKFLFRCNIFLGIF